MLAFRMTRAELIAFLRKHMLTVVSSSRADGPRWARFSDFSAAPNQAGHVVEVRVAG